MTDQELLMQAAKAADFKGAWGHEGYIERNEGFIRDGWRRAWDPLENNADAFELMVATGLLLLPDLQDKVVEEMGAANFKNRESATRRAIVCSAVSNHLQLPQIPAAKE